MQYCWGWVMVHIALPEQEKLWVICFLWSSLVSAKW